MVRAGLFEALSASMIFLAIAKKVDVFAG